MPKTKTIPPADEAVLEQPAGEAASVKTPVEKPPTKTEQVLALLRRPQGASLAELQAATGWQAHSVRGALAGTIKKKLGHEVGSAKIDGVRVYRIPAGEAVVASEAESA